MHKESSFCRLSMDFNRNRGDVFEIFEVGGAFVNNFSNIRIEGLDESFQFEIVYDGNSVFLVTLSGGNDRFDCSINYVDANLNNTTLANGDALVEGSHFDVGVIDDNDRWNIRPFANEGTVFSSNNFGGGYPENAPRLRTTISGLDPGNTYEVFVYFWGAINENWSGRASLTDELGDLQGYDTNHVAASVLMPMDWVTLHINPDGLNTQSPFEFDPTALSIETNRSLYEVHLGQAVTDENGEINVYIDDVADVSFADRTWYDGVGYLLSNTEFEIGDVNLDGEVNLLDVAPFVELLTANEFQIEADINQDGSLDLLDIAPFVALLTGG